MTFRYLTCEAKKKIPLGASGGYASAVHVIDAEHIDAIDAALATGRPLLVRGDPGTGKSQLAHAAAVELGRAFVSHTVDARTETRDLLYTVDAVARLAEAQVLGALGKEGGVDPRERIAVGNFVHPGILWWAFDWSSAAAQAAKVRGNLPVTPAGWTRDDGVVVLVDEIDKADGSVPNGLLDALGNGRFEVPVGAVEAHARPLVVITTNEERALPDAFLRRCLVLHLALPEQRDALEALLMVRGEAHFPSADGRVLTKAAALVADDREKLANRNISLPGTAEYIDLVRAVTQREPTDIERQLALLERVRGFALQKHPEERGR